MKLCKWVMMSCLGSNIPGTYIGDRFVETLVQTRQSFLGPKGSCIHHPEIVGHELEYGDPRFLLAEDFTHSPFAETTLRHAVLTR